MNACIDFFSARRTAPAPDLETLNQCLNLALATSRQIAFDWNLDTDVVRFCGERITRIGSLPLDEQGCCTSVQFISVVHEGDQPLLRQSLVRALKAESEEQEIHRVEVRIRDAQTQWRWIDVSGRVVERDAQGRASRLVGGIGDINERKQAEMKLLRLRDLYMALSQTNQAIVRIKQRDTLFQEICRIAVDYGRFQAAWISLFNENVQNMKVVAAYGAGMEEVQDLAASHFGSSASFTFMHEGRRFGALNLYAAEPGLFDDDSLIELLEEMTRDISFAIDNYAREAEREEIKNDLVESEQFKSAILTAALDAIISVDDSGNIISFNRAAERTFGLRHDDVLGRNLVDVLVPEPWREKMRAGMANLLANSESWLLNQRIELTAMRADGLPFPVELALVPIRVRQRRIFTAFIRDISEIKQSQALLNENATRYRQLVELSPEAIFVHRDEKLVLVNQAAVAMLGAHDTLDLVGKNLFDFIHPEYHDVYRDSCLNSLHPKGSHFVEQQWIRIDGGEFHAEVAASAMIYDGASATQTVVRDITLRKRAEELQLGQNRILNMVATGVELGTILNEIALFIEAHSRRGLCSVLLLNASGDALVNGASPNLPRSYTQEVDRIEVSPSGGSCGTAIFRAEPVIVTDIETDALWTTWREPALRHGLKACSSWPIFGKNRKILGTIALYFRDPITPTAQELQLFDICTKLAGIAIENRASEERIRHLAHYDGLTSLPNRFLFKEFLELALRNAQRNGTKFAVFFIDLDKFKDINDNHGHDAGDHVLREIAGRLRSCLRQNDKIARMGGDEFYILIEDLADSRFASEIAQKLVDEASQPIDVNGHECRVSVSVGIGIYPDDGHNGQALLRNADQAMYRVKNLGKNGYQFFSASGDPSNTIRLPPAEEIFGLSPRH